MDLLRERTVVDVWPLLFITKVATNLFLLRCSNKYLWIVTKTYRRNTTRTVSFPSVSFGHLLMVFRAEPFSILPLGNWTLCVRAGSEPNAFNEANNFALGRNFVPTGNFIEDTLPPPSPRPNYKGSRARRRRRRQQRVGSGASPGAAG